MSKVSKASNNMENKVKNEKELEKDKRNTIMNIREESKQSFEPPMQCNLDYRRSVCNKF